MRISDWSSDVCSSDLPHDRLRPACSRVEQTFRPAPGGAGEQPPLVEAMGAVVPELDHVRHNPIARPVRWPGHGLAFEPLSLLLEPALEQRERKSTRLKSSH